MSYVHPVAQAYFNKLQNAGYSLTSESQQDIDNFCSQLSLKIDPCLWTCWPMRSIHNAGSGTTLFTVGSFSNTNATVVNSPTWGTDGMFFAEATDQIVNTNIKLGTNGSIVVITKVRALSSGDGVLVDQSTSNTGWGITTEEVFGSYTSTMRVNTPSLDPIAFCSFTPNSFMSCIGYWMINNLSNIYTLYSINNSQLNDQHNILGLEGTEGSTPFTIGNQISTSQAIGADIACVIYFKNNSFNIQDSTKRASIINILRQTLCKGLGI